MARLLPLLTAIALVISSGLVHGRWSHRRADAKALEAATARLSHLPETLGDWRGEPIDFDQRGLDRAGIAGLVARRYENRRTGASVSILLVCGHPGPIAVHGPEICYAGAGYEQVTPIVKRTLGDGDFWMSHFRKQGPIEDPLLRIYWAWSAGDRWQAAESPRVQYAENSVLYKLYLLYDSVASGERQGDGDDPCREFAEELLAALRGMVSPSQ
jgi:Protein of unknown function (DUF3485)